jgi:hypothetical protein
MLRLINQKGGEGMIFDDELRKINESNQEFDAASAIFLMACLDYAKIQYSIDPDGDIYCSDDIGNKIIDLQTEMLELVDKKIGN